MKRLLLTLPLDAALSVVPSSANSAWADKTKPTKTTVIDLGATTNDSVWADTILRLFFLF